MQNIPFLKHISYYTITNRWPQLIHWPVVALPPSRLIMLPSVSVDITPNTRQSLLSFCFLLACVFYWPFTVTFPSLWYGTLGSFLNCLNGLTPPSLICLPPAHSLPPIPPPPCPVSLTISPTITLLVLPAEGLVMCTGDQMVHVSST